MKRIRKDTPGEVFVTGLIICGCVGMFVYAVMGMLGAVQ